MPEPVEDVLPDGVVAFFGEHFQVPERINQRRYLKLASLANKGVDSDSMEGDAAVNALIDQCLLPEDVDRFDDVCDRERPGFEELMAFVAQTMAVVASRPTRRSSGSSAGPSTTAPSSEPSAVDRALMLVPGRPDVAMALMMADEEQTA